MGKCPKMGLAVIAKLGGFPARVRCTPQRLQRPRGSNRKDMGREEGAAGQTILLLSPHLHLVAHDQHGADFSLWP